MSYGNELTIAGNLTSEPELRHTSTGIAVANLRIAWNPPKRDGQPDKDPTFLTVTAWRDLAENLAELAKGTRVILTGRIESRTFDTKDGERRTVIEMTAEDGGRSLRFRDKPGGQPSQPPSAVWGAPTGQQPPF